MGDPDLPPADEPPFPCRMYPDLVRTGFIVVFILGVMTYLASGTGEDPWLWAAIAALGFACGWLAWNCRSEYVLFERGEIRIRQKHEFLRELVIRADAVDYMVTENEQLRIVIDGESIEMVFQVGEFPPSIIDRMFDYVEAVQRHRTPE